ncbi:MAG: plastocyanin/azurin family copper-binding protein [Planctomycetota bacterium JB042]
MKFAFAFSAALAAFSVPASAQVHDVTAAHHAFTDSVSGTSVTSITLGTTVRWTAGAHAPHTVTSGSGSSDAGSGALFQQTLAEGQSFTYTPTSVGVIPYYCVQHEAHGMTGLLLVKPDTADHVVFAHHHRFFDGVTGADVTMLELGDTVRWIAGHNAPHTVTSGTGSGDVNAGLQFQQTLFTPGESFTFTPVEAGMQPYFCVEHEVHGMKGTLHVMPPATWPGTGDDLELSTGVDAAPDSVDVKSLSAGNVLSIGIDSPEATLTGAPLVLALSAFPTGTTPASPLPGIHFDPAAAVIVTQGAFGWPLVVPPGGVSFGLVVPPVAAGTSIMLQAAALSANTHNGVFAATDGHELQLQ